MLAAELHVPVDEVAALYERERANLAEGAHTTKFLHIFAMRSVQDILRTRALGKPSPPQLGGLSPPSA